jgi:hypothetical protein
MHETPKQELRGLCWDAAPPPVWVETSASRILFYQLQLVAASQSPGQNWQTLQESADK